MSTSDFVDDNSLASVQAANIMAEDSPLMEQAETKAKQYTNQSGLLNSTMGTSAALDSVTSVASELGQHQAEMYGDAQKITQQGSVDKGLLEQEIQGAANLSEQQIEQQGALDKDLLSQEIQGTSDLSAQQIQGEKDLSSQEYSQELGTIESQSVAAKDLASFNADIAEKAQLLTQQFEAEQAERGYEEVRISNMTSMVNSQTQVLMAQIGTLLNNEDIEMGDSVVEWMTDFQNASWESAAALMDLDIEVA